MKRIKIIFIIFVIMALISFTSCSSENDGVTDRSPLVGIWGVDFDIIELREDGTGTSAHGQGLSTEIKWSTYNGRLTLYFIGYYDEVVEQNTAFYTISEDAATAIIVGDGFIETWARLN